jgi:hypothetical protein
VAQQLGATRTKPECPLDSGSLSSRLHDRSRIRNCGPTEADRAGVLGAVALPLDKAAANEGHDGKRTVDPAAGWPAGTALRPTLPRPEMAFSDPPARLADDGAVSFAFKLNRSPPSEAVHGKDGIKFFLNRNKKLPMSLKTKSRGRRVGETKLPFAPKPDGRRPRLVASDLVSFAVAGPFPVAKTPCRGRVSRFQMAHFFQKQSHQVIENTREVAEIG